MLFSKTLVSVATILAVTLQTVQAVPSIMGLGDGIPQPPSNAFTPDGQYIPLSERVFSAEDFEAHDKLEKRVDLPGVNNWDCKPKPGQAPLILVHGLLGNGWDNWVFLAPRFLKRGYCVFSITYGRYKNIPLFAGLDKMENSAQQLSDFIDKVLLATGAKEVDLVGHSQGSLMPRYYIKNMGGAAKVRKFAAFGSVVYGTDLWGVVPFLTGLGLYDPIKKIVDPLCLSCYQLLVDSPFLKELNAGGDTAPDVEYRFIVSMVDSVVTPYTNGILRDKNPKAKSLTLQELCPLDLSNHLTMVNNGIVFSAIHAFLSPSAPQTVNCFSALN
ncbi:hypothetical protein DFQ27_009046 [Actinomortierella ambigua]|uniref:Triacylglycerol lipase n=1 Tax=Actinomortierella ambigua TaxID=1343610 RepID=A0A9P6QMZ7_9FUNG|nr:hypothetical protein DFQ27_009046 [Actinomortierella ambigua]